MTAEVYHTKAPVLITGYTGFIGRSVTARLDDLGLPWVGFDGDVCTYGDFNRYDKCRSVLHLAGKTRAGLSRDELLRLMDVNVVGTYNTARFAALGGREFFLASTCCYSPEASLPYAESTPLSSLSAYWASKTEAENIVLTMGNHLGLRGAIFRIFNVYGPGQPLGFLVPDLLDKIRSGKVHVHNLEDERDFIHVDDAANLMRRVLLADNKGMVPVNVGSGEKHSVGEVLEKLISLTGTSPTISSAGSRSRIPSSQADTTFAQKNYGWRPAITLADGLKEVIRHQFKASDNS